LGPSGTRDLPDYLILDMGISNDNPAAPITVTQRDGHSLLLIFNFAAREITDKDSLSCHRPSKSCRYISGEYALTDR
jgi:hypothetical protein